MSKLDDMNKMRLVIFKVNQLGDNVVFLPVVQKLITVLPEAQVTVITSPIAEQLYLKSCPSAKTLAINTNEFNNAWKNPLLLWRLIKMIRKINPDICLLGDDQGNVAHILARVSRARLTVGPLILNRKLGFFLDYREPVIVSEHIAVQNWKIAKLLIRLLKLESELDLEFPPAPDLTAFGVKSGAGILIHPGASREYKRWPIERFVELANNLADSYPVTWVNIGASVEVNLNPRVRRVATSDIGELIAEVAGAELFIGNNSGPMNIASAVGCPGIIFNGPSTHNWDPYWHPQRYHILRDRAVACQPCDHITHPVNVCNNVQKPMICMKRWEVADVIEIVKKSIGLAPP